MKVLYAASEALPFIASGGLGDVAGSLPQALRKRLVGCRVVMPLYDNIKQEFKDNMKFITSISVPVAWRRQYCGIFEARAGGVIYYIVYQVIVFLGLDTDLLKMLSAAVVAIFLGAPNLKNKLMSNLNTKKHAREAKDNA